MASFSLQRLINQLKNLFNTYCDIFPGYEISSGDVENKSGECSAEIIYHPTVAGDTTDVRVVIGTANIQEAFSDVIRFIDKLSWDTIKNNSLTFEGLTGLTISDDVKLNDITLDVIEQNGKGLLGIDFTKAKPTDIDTWREYALDKLIYNLLCETALDDAGKVSNQKLMACVKWIHSYMNYVRSNRDNIRDSEKDQEAGVEVKEQLSEQEIKDRQEDNKKQINSEDDAINLVMPILARIQGELKKMYQDKLNSDLNIENEDEDEGPEEGTDEGNDENTNESTENSNDIHDVDQNAGEEDDQSVFDSKHFSIKLQKIEASDELNILALNSNYAPADTLSDIDDIINQEEFLSALTDEPQSFEVTVDDNGYDIEQCDNCESDPCASLCEAFKAGIRAYRNLYILHWMSSGKDMMKLHNLSEEMYDELKDEIDTIGELLVEKQGTVSQLDFPCDYIPVQKYDFLAGLDQIKSLIQMYIDCLDFAYCNQDSDVQSTLDEWLRYWNKQLNYFVKNQEM